MKKVKVLLLLPVFLMIFQLAGAELRPVLLLGHGSDTWKVGKSLAAGNIASKTLRNWPSVDSYSGYAAVYVGESVQGIALNAWNEADFRKIEKFVSAGGTLIFSGDTVQQLNGGKSELGRSFSRLLGFGRLAQFPAGKGAFAADPSGTVQPGWVRKASWIAEQLSTARVLMNFDASGKKFAAVTENDFGKGKVFFLAPNMHRIAGNGEVELGKHGKNGKWELTAQGKSAEDFSRYIFTLFDRLPQIERIPVRHPAVVTGGDASRVRLALNNANVEFESAKKVIPADFARYALVYIGETLKYDKTRKSWLGSGELQQVRSYLENGGVIITSGAIPTFLAGESRNMKELAPLFGFSAFRSVKTGDVKEFVFTAEGEEIKKKAELKADSYDWSNRVNCVPDKLTTAIVLGEFRTPKGNIPALTVNYTGKGAFYWIATNPFKLVPNRNENLGDPDDNGIFILNRRGEAAAALQKLFIALFNTPPYIAIRKEFPEKSQWGLIPLGEPGNIPFPSEFRNKVVYKAPQVLKDAFLLSKDGKAQAVIVSPGKSTDKLAAKLQQYLKEISGASFKRVRSLPQGSAIVLFDEKTASVAGRDLKSAGTDTAIVETRGNRIFVGGKEMGASLALHYLLEKFGCRQLWPGKTGRIVPRKPTLYAPEVQLVSTPKLSTRAIRFVRKYYPKAVMNSQKCGVDHRRYLDATGDDIDRFFSWHGVISNREKNRKWAIGLSHASKGNLYHRFGKSHPEYFALQSNGSRSQTSSASRYRICHSNKNMIRQVAADCIRAIEAAPGTKVVSIPLTDGGGTTFCMCVNCRKLDPVNAIPENIPFLMGMTRQNVKYVALTDRVLTFSNAVAEIVARKYPDVKVYMYIYSHYSSSPVKVKPHPSLLILLANMSYSKESVRQRHLRDMMKFSTFQGEYFWRTNALWGFNSVLAPQNYARKMFEDLELFKANLITGTDLDCFERHWAFKTLLYYTLAKAHWNPDRLSFDSIAEDFCRQGFGPAAPEIMQFFEILEKTTDAAAEREGDYLEFFDEKVIASLRALLAGAKAKAANDPAIVERIDFLTVGVDGGELNRRLFVARKQKNSEEYEKLREQFISFIRQTAERYPLALYPAYVGQYNDFVK